MLRRHAKSILFSFGLFLGLTITVYAQPIKALFHQSNNPMSGNPNGNITVVEFFDYQCSHCIDMVPVTTAIIKANPNVRFIYKDFPIRGPVSEFAALAALAANKQGKYSEFNHALFAANQPLTQENIFSIAKNIGLNVTQLKKDMNSHSIINQLNANIKLAQELKLNGTPAFFVGKTNATNKDNISYALGALTESEFQNMIDNASK